MPTLRAAEAKTGQLRIALARAQDDYSDMRAQFLHQHALYTRWNSRVLEMEQEQAVLNESIERLEQRVADCHNNVFQNALADSFHF